jgi:hypothetical protein
VAEVHYTPLLLNFNSIDTAASFPYTDFMDQVYAQVKISDVFAPAANFSSLGPLVTVVVSNAFVLAGIIAFLLLIMGGFGIIASAGSGDTKKMEQGKQAITGAAIGLIVIVGSFWIVQIIQTVTGVALLPK